MDRPQITIRGGRRGINRIRLDVKTGGRQEGLEMLQRIMPAIQLLDSFLHRAGRELRQEEATDV